MQALWPVLGLKVPTGHDRHAEKPVPPTYVPAAHDTQDAELVWAVLGLYVPTPQFVQTGADEVVQAVTWYLPAEHTLQGTHRALHMTEAWSMLAPVQP